MNKSFSLKMKLVLLCAFLLSISAGVGGISYYTLNNVSYNYDFVIEKAVPKTKLSYEMMLSYRRLRVQVRTLGIQGLSPKSAEETVKDIHVSMADYEKANSEYVSLGFIPGQKELYDKVQAAWLDFKGLGEHVISLDKTGRLEDKEKMIQIFLNDCPKKALAYTAAVENLIQFHQNVLENRSAEARAAAVAGNNLNIFTILLGVAVGLGIGLLIATKITRAVAQVSKDLAMGSEQVAAASVQIASSSQSLSEAASEQAASLEETVATMEELTSMVRLNTENGKQAANLSVSTRDVALKGEAEIKKLIDSIYSISSDSKKIEEITTVIDDIAFQTNLLALNAAVEAARAGEQGKGFAVVADAVRTLAQKSAEAAKDIADLIKGSVEKIEVGSQQANQGGVVLAEIVSAVKKVADLNNEIASASEEQSNGITQIGKAMNQMDQVTQQNAAAAEETAASAEELSAQAESLKTNVAALETLVYGTTQNHVATTSEKSEKASKKSSNVVQFKKSETKGQTSNPAAKAIPFDEDEVVEHRKVGTTDGF